jgi:hypothetical protein
MIVLGLADEKKDANLGMRCDRKKSARLRRRPLQNKSKAGVALDFVGELATLLYQARIPKRYDTCQDLG